MSNFEQFNQIRYTSEYTPDISDESRINIYKKLVGSNKKILDVGCWNGHIGNILKMQNNYVVGLDNSSEAIKTASKILNQVHNIDLNSDWTHAIAEKFDIVFCGEIIEHVFDTDEFLDNVEKVIKNNGRIIVSTPNIASLGRRLLLLIGLSPNIETTCRKNDSGHIRYFTLKNLCQLLEDHKFKIEFKTANIINFSNSGAFSSKFLAKILPTFGTTLIVSAVYKR